MAAGPKRKVPWKFHEEGVGCSAGHGCADLLWQFDCGALRTFPVCLGHNRSQFTVPMQHQNPCSAPFLGSIAHNLVCNWCEVHLLKQ